MSIPAAEPLPTLRARIEAWAGSVLLADAVPALTCPRCDELAVSSAWSDTPHAHSDAELGALLLAEYRAQLGRAAHPLTRHQGRVSELLRRGATRPPFDPGARMTVTPIEVGRGSPRPYTQLAAAGMTDAQLRAARWAAVDPLGPAAPALGGLDSSPLAAWEAAERARQASNTARQTAATGPDRRRARKASASAAADVRELAPQVAAWWQPVADLWPAHAADLAHLSPEPTPTRRKALAWH